MSKPDRLTLDHALALAHAERQRRCRADYHAFYEWVIRDERGRPSRQSAIHRAMILHVEHCWRRGIYPAFLGPIEHGKTMQLVVGRPAWELGNDVQLRIKLISANDPMAMKRVTTITSVLRSAAYREVFPHVRFVAQSTARRTGKKAKETQHEITIDREGHSNDPSVEATGILMPGSGGRADLEIFDDVVEQRNAIDHPAEREKVIQNFEDVWMTRLGPTARPLFVGQPWHEQDLTHRIMRSRGWCTLLARIAEDCSRIDLEVFNPPADYPIPERLAEHPAFEDQGRDARMRVA